MADYNYYPLRFSNKAEADSKIYTNGTLRYWFTQVRGTLYSPPVFNDAGALVTPPVAKTGWHVDIASKDALAVDLQPYLVQPFPMTPDYVWYTNNEGVM